MNIGDTIECIDNQDSDSLEFGHEYVIVDINEHGNLGVKNEATGSLLRHYYKPNRFNVLDEAKEDCGIQVGQIYKYDSFYLIDETPYMVVEVDWYEKTNHAIAYCLVNLETGQQHYPQDRNINDVFCSNNDMFLKVADNLKQYIAQK